MKLAQRRKAIELRKKGYSLNEISDILSVSKSSVSLWVRDIKLTDSAKAKLLSKLTAGQLAGAESRLKKTKKLEEGYLKEAQLEVFKNPDYGKIICAVIYWCEGTKNPRNGLVFTNSDPNLVSKFLELLRGSFDIDESKFRPCIHLHSYHSTEKQLAFWSKVTKINRSQFVRPYIKTNSGKRIHDNYQGCISLRYHNNDLARRLMAMAKAFLKGVW